MAISANGTTNGILWTLQSTGSSSPGILHAYDATNLANELYNSNQAGSRDTLDTWLKFSLPLVANGKVFVAGVSQLTVYGLLPNGNGVQTASVASTPAQTQVSMSAGRPGFRRLFSRPSGGGFGFHADATIHGGPRQWRRHGNGDHAGSVAVE